MNSSHQETPADVQETEFGGLSRQKRIVHFSSGETLEEEDSEDSEDEEEPSSSRAPFSEPAHRTSFSFRKVAVLVGRISLLTCDFLGERLAAALGLNAAKYQYAIDQHHRDQETKSSQLTDDLMGGRAVHLSAAPDQYGATGRAVHLSAAPDQYGATGRAVHLSAAPDQYGATGRAVHLSAAPGRYGATGRSQSSCEETPEDRREGRHNTAYQADEDSLK